MSGIKIIIFFLLISLNLWTQTAEQMLKETETHLLKKLSKNALKQNDPNAAITFLEAYIKSHKKDAEAYYLLANAYAQTRNYEKAKQNFLTSYKTQDKKGGDALFYHAQMQKSTGKYDSAKFYFEKFKKEYKGSNKAIKKQAVFEVTYCDSIQKLTKDTYKTTITRLDTAINKVNSESAPIAFGRNKLVFASLRTNKKEYIFEDDSSQGIKRKLYWAEKKKDKWVFKGEFGDNFNSEDFNVGNAAFSGDNKRMYFTKCHLNDEEEMICAIYVSLRKGDKWSEPEKLPKIVNAKKVTNTMPAVATDPVKGDDIIYFVSNRRGGKGGFDIWSTVYSKKNKEYKAPKNLGSKINTPGNEMSPFFDSETRSLYFSSNDLPGLGGYDIYKANGDGKRWISVENIGKPFNSGTDDIYFSISPQHDEGFFVSNRKGGAALPNATCCDDIYHYKIKQLIFVNLKGNVKQDEKSKIPLADAKVEIYAKDKLTNEKYLIKTVSTDSLGNYNTFLEPNKLYEVVIRKKEFLSKSEIVSTQGYVAGQDCISQIKVEKKPTSTINLPDIGYEFGSAELTAKSKEMLDKGAFNFLMLNPSLIIEVHSHTDGKGTDEFNMKLSQKRAQNIVNYLSSKGIKKNRLIPKGYGESEPIAPNQKADGSDNPEGRAKNRRTEMKIVGESEEYITE